MEALAHFPAAPGLRIGLLGGSFNPAHEGHLAISLVALKLLALDRVVWLVSPHNPLKERAGLGPYAARLASAKAMISGHPRLIVSDIEDAFGLTYTIDTVTLLKRTHREARFVYLMGADNLLTLPRWRAWQRLMESIPFAVFARPGFDLAAVNSRPAIRFRAHRLALAGAPRLAETAPPAWVYIPFTHHEISATALRRSGEWPKTS